MSGYLNRVQLIGNLGRDPEVRATRDGKLVVTLVIATSESWRDDRGNRVERTEWHRIVIFSEGLGQIGDGDTGAHYMPEAASPQPSRMRKLFAPSRELS